MSGPDRVEELPHDEDDGDDDDDSQEKLGNVATGLAEQLTSITEEMNKLRQELYGEHGIGGIAAELQKLKTGNLGGLLEGSATEGLGGNGSESSSASQSLHSDAAEQSSPNSGARGGDEHSPLLASGAGTSGHSSSSAARQAAGAETRRRRTPEERDREIEQLRRKLRDKRSAMDDQPKAPAVSLLEKFVLVLLVFVVLFVGSPLFRSSVKRAAAGLVGADMPPADDEEAEIVQDY